MYTRSSVFATIIVQLFFSMVLLAALALSMVSMIRVANMINIENEVFGGTRIALTEFWRYIPPLFPILGSISTLYLMFLAARVWICGSWKYGVKDLHHTPGDECSVFRHRRLNDDDVRTVMHKILELLRKFPTRLLKWLSKMAC